MGITVLFEDKFPVVRLTRSWTRQRRSYPVSSLHETGRVRAYSTRLMDTGRCYQIRESVERLPMLPKNTHSTVCPTADTQHQTGEKRWSIAFNLKNLDNTREKPGSLIPTHNLGITRSGVRRHLLTLKVCRHTGGTILA